MLLGGWVFQSQGRWVIENRYTSRKNKNVRFFTINSSDVQRLLRVSARTAQRDIKKIKSMRRGSHRGPVTIKEFCKYYGYKPRDVRRWLRVLHSTKSKNDMDPSLN